MSQSKLSAVLFKTAFMSGLTFLVIPFFTPAHAQTSNNQTQMLFEMQAMREEIAELRDMVERQQYEMRKIQQQLKSPQAQSVIPDVSQQNLSVPSIISPNDGGLSQGVAEQASLLSGSTALSNGVESSESVTAVIPNVNTASAGVAQSVAESVSNFPQDVGLSQEAGLPQKISSTTQSTGREYPPVVEISVGGDAAQKADQTNNTVSSSTAVLSNTITESTSTIQSAASNAVSNVASVQGQVSEGLSVNSVVGADQSRSLSALDIQPIETIASKPVVSIPSVQGTLDTVQASGASAVSSVEGRVAVLDSASVVNVTTENEYYQRGFSFLKESKHTEAVDVFKEQISVYPKGDRADDAYYWIAESMYVNRKLSESKENFKAIIQSYPKSERLPDAMLKLAYIEQEQGNIIESRILLQEIMQFHPKSDAALLAKNRLADIK